MNITTCLPISKQHGLETLTYFSDIEYPRGAIISIPIRHKFYPAIVLEQKSLERSKAEIKNLSFNLKQLPKTKIETYLPTTLIDAIYEIADRYAGEASTIAHLALQHLDLINNPNQIKPARKKSEVVIWQAKYLDFFRELDKLIRYKNNRIAIIVADRNELHFFAELLKQFKPLIVRPTSSSTVKNKFADSPLIITTRGLGAIATITHNTIITINPGGDSWREQRRPHFLWDDLIATIASNLGHTIIHYSTVATQMDWLKFLESKRKQHHFINNEYAPNPNVSLIERSGGHKHELDTVFDRRVQHLITNNIQAGKKTLLYVTRRGLYPVLSCNDCKATTYTKAFMEQVQRYSIAKAASDWVDPETAEEWTDRCPNCRSWRLYPVALSLGQTIQVLKKIINSDQIFTIDTVNQKPSESAKIIKQFENSDSGVLVTTQRGIYQLTTPVDDVVIVSIDAALSSNSVSIETQMLRLLYHLESTANDKIVIQTRLDNNHVLRTFTSGKIRSWQRDSLDQRKSLDFPPYSTQVKLVLPERYHSQEITQALNQHLNPQHVTMSVLPGLKPGTTILLTIKNEYWYSGDSYDLRELLKSMALNIKMFVNPDVLM